MAFETLLVISAIGIPPYSCRGATQTLEPIAASQMLRRTVNGLLINLAPIQFQKYTSTISAADVNPPAIDGAWSGRALTVDCVSELSYLTAGGAPERNVVAGSSRVEGDFTFYRPRLQMLLVHFRASTDEWGAVVTWSLTLEEE